MLQNFHVSFSSCCNIFPFTFFTLQFFHVALFYVALFACCALKVLLSSFCIFLLLHSLHVALFSRLNFVYVAHFPCCTLFKLHFFSFAFFSCCAFLTLKSIKNEQDKESSTIKMALHSKLSLFHF